MKKLIITTLLLLPVVLRAQDTTYNESVLVQGSYHPVIEKSEKLTFPPFISDTIARVTHDFTYYITPVRLKSLYEPVRIKAARIIGEPSTKLYNNYLRLGLGYYPSTLADLYWCSTRDRKKTYGVSLNHRFSWASIPDYGTSHFGNTGVTLFGKYIVKDKLQLSTSVDYEHDHNLYYGFTDDSLLARLDLTRDSISATDYRAKYNIATWNIGLRNMQLDANKFGYAVNLRLSDLWASWNQNEFSLNLSGDLRYGFTIKRKHKGVAYLHAEWDGYKYQCNPDGMPLGYDPALAVDSSRGSRNIVKVNPYADFMFSGLQFHVGATAGWDAFSDPTATTFRLFPDVTVSKKFMSNALVLTLGATGGIDANDWDAIRKLNPYVAPDAEQRATRHYDFMAHMRWTVSKKLEARAEVSYSLLNDDLTFTLDPSYTLQNIYTPAYLDLNRLCIGGDVAFVNDEMLTIRGGAHYYSYSKVAYRAPQMANMPLLYRPDWDLSLTANFNYNDKWLVQLESRLLGKMQGDLDTEMPLRYGIDAQVEYRHNRALSFFLRLDNLAFQRYYYWANYPSPRGLALLGLTYTIPHK